MKRNTVRPWHAAFVLAFFATSLFASGGGSSTPPAPSTPTLTPEQVAMENYNTGLKLRQKALELDDEIARETNAKKVAKLERKRDSAFEKATKRYEAAIDAKPDFVQAHGSLGYALRRLGQFEEAMTSYDKALSLNPNYPAAIEYRAEALLGLGRVDEVKEAYQKLSMMSADHAAELMAAVKAWAADQANAEAAASAGVMDWTAAHERVSAETSSGGKGGKLRWR